VIEQQPESEPAAERSGVERGRLEPFSDGVFAIAITLLILEVRTPLGSTSLFHDVGRQWPALLGYVISFVTILIMWINHHRLVDQLARVDNTFLLLNGLLLMAITFVNYPTSLMAEYLTTSEARDALLIYSGTFVVVAIIFNLLWFYAARGNRLLGPHANPKAVEAITRAYRVGPLYYLVALVIALLSWELSLAVNGLLAVYFAILGSQTDGSRRF
jgi:uncharacterized membrane protein